MITNSIQLVYTKIRVSSPEESIRIQRRAFDIGFFWPYTEGRLDPIHTNEKFIFFDSRYMSYSSSTKFFNDQREHQEITLTDMFGDETYERDQEPSLNEQAKTAATEFDKAVQSSINQPANERIEIIKQALLKFRNETKNK